MANEPIGRRLGLVLYLLALGTVVIGLAAAWLLQRSFPRTDGLIHLADLDGEVDIYRSPDGVPHIYATTDHDLFFAQGYVHAQDRFWQMDFSRHIGSGRLAEMFGESQLETDAFLRTLGWRRLAERESERLDPEVVTILEAYAEGVNAYLRGRSATATSLEYAVLGLLSPDYRIEPWTPADTLTWAKVMAWDLGGNLDGEIDRALLLNHLSMEQVRTLYPPYPEDHPVIVPAPEGEESSSSPSASAVAQLEQADLFQVRERLERINELRGTGSAGIGSNNWVISGEHTASGGALLANDTHLGIQMPSIWYENGLHCRAVTPACRFNVGGFSFPGVPTVIIGHNDRIAWGLTNTGPDVQDLFIERVDPSNRNRYQFEGEWREMAVRQEVIQVAGGEPVPITIRETHHGPLISETYGPLEGFGERAGVELPARYALALRWTALEPSTLFSAVIQLNQARNWEEFRAAAAKWDVPSQNLVYADVEGNIGYQMPGKIPLRSSGDGWLPVPGWSGEHEWAGYVPFEELPKRFNPPAGYLATANNAVVPGGYPYYLERSWDLGYRAARIEGLLADRTGLTITDMQEIQGDNRQPLAAVLPPLLSDLDLATAEQEHWADRLAAWQGENDADSAEAALFNAFWRQLIHNTFADELPDGPLPHDSRGYRVVELLLARPDSEWWDDVDTSKREDRDTILKVSFERAFEELQTELGKDPEGWRWGDLHTATFRNLSLGESGVPPVEAIFNRGPFPVGGGSSVVNQTDWDIAEGFEVTSLPSQRLIIDLADLDVTRTIHTTGQSGHAFHPHYVNQVDRWRQLEFHRHPWSPEEVAANAAAHLRLAPVGPGD